MRLRAPGCVKSENELKNQLMASEYRCCCHSQGFSAEAQQVEEQSGLSTAGYSGPLDQYSGLIRDGSLREDEHQKAVLQKLDQLHKTLRGYSNTPTSIFSKVEPTSSSSQHLNSRKKSASILQLRNMSGVIQFVILVQTLWLDYPTLALKDKTAKEAVCSIWSRNLWLQRKTHLQNLDSSLKGLFTCVNLGALCCWEDVNTKWSHFMLFSVFWDVLRGKKTFHSYDDEQIVTECKFWGSCMPISDSIKTTDWWGEWYEYIEMIWIIMRNQWILKFEPQRANSKTNF